MPQVASTSKMSVVTDVLVTKLRVWLQVQILWSDPEPVVLLPMGYFSVPFEVSNRDVYTSKVCIYFQIHCSECLGVLYNSYPISSNAVGVF